MKPLATIEEFRAALAAKALVLVRDAKFGERVHRLPCDFATAHTFQMKVVANQGRTGSFHEITEEEAAGVRRCPKCP